jgi:hypothetical protein
MAFTAPISIKFTINSWNYMRNLCSPKAVKRYESYGCMFFYGLKYNVAITEPDLTEFTLGRQIFVNNSDIEFHKN